MALLHKLADDKQANLEDELQSILENLTHILNTKRGYGGLLPQFGLSDYHHLSVCDDIAELIVNEVTENIILFEPRIELQQVINMPRNGIFRLCFQIDCLVQGKPQSLKLFLEPVIDHYQVSL